MSRKRKYPAVCYSEDAGIKPKQEQEKTMFEQFMKWHETYYEDDPLTPEQIELIRIILDNEPQEVKFILSLLNSFQLSTELGIEL